MNHEYAPKHVAQKTSLASLAALMFAALFFLAIPAGANERSPSEADGEPSPLVGMKAEFDERSERLLVEIPEKCRLATYENGEGFSLAIEDDAGTRTTFSGDGTRIGVSDGRLAVASDGDTLGEKSEVVEAEGFVCLETPEEDEGRVLSQTATASETNEEDETTAPESGESRTQNASSAGQQTEPLSGSATINRVNDDENGDIESITITADCEDGEEATVADRATITIEEDGTGDPFEFTDGGTGNVDITSAGSTVTIAPTDDGADFVPGGNEDLEGGTATVEEQTGITCGAVSTNDEANTENTSGSCASGQSFADVAAFSRAAGAGETMQSEEFTTTGDFFRIRFTATSTGTNADDAGFRASVLGGAATESFAADFGGGAASDSGTLTADLPAGTYRFRVVAENVQYDITVSECRAASNTSSGNPGGNVITSTVPDKTLANTGGPSLGVMAAGVLFAAVGVSLAWLLARRGRGA